VRTFESTDELIAAVGEQVGHGAWHTVTQEQISGFADATGDHQWIHVDPERAAQGPFGTTVAHGYLTLSMIPMLVAPVMAVRGVRLALNYGLNRVRFPRPLPVGTPVRAEVRIASAERIEPDGVHLVSEVTVAADDGGKPFCVAETVTRYYA
jgi:acyl dehydratase